VVTVVLVPCFTLETSKDDADLTIFVPTCDPGTRDECVLVICVLLGVTTDVVAVMVVCCPALARDCWTPAAVVVRFDGIPGLVTVWLPEGVKLWIPSCGVIAWVTVTGGDAVELGVADVLTSVTQ
jgi:hypothetical protein